MHHLLPKKQYIFCQKMNIKNANFYRIFTSKNYLKTHKKNK